MAKWWNWNEQFFCEKVDVYDAFCLEKLSLYSGEPIKLKITVILV